MDQAYVQKLQAQGFRVQIVRQYKDLLKIRDEFVVGHNGYRIPFLLLIGPHGTAKSTAFRKADGVQYANDAVSAPGLYRLAWKHQDKTAIVLDDVDPLMTDVQAVALLKALGECGDKNGLKTLCWEKMNSAMEADGIPTYFTTSTRLCIICNDLPKINKHIQAVIDRAKVVLFWPTTEEIHNYIGTWWPDEHGDILEFFGQNLDRIISPSIRWYEDAQREKRLNNDWRAWLLEQWYHENPRMAIIAEMYRSGIPKGKPMEDEWHRRTGLGRALFYRLQREYLEQHQQPPEPPDDQPNDEKP